MKLFGVHNVQKTELKQFSLNQEQVFMLKCIDMPHNTNSSIKRQLFKLLTHYLIFFLSKNQLGT